MHSHLLYRRVVYLRQGGKAADRDHPNATTKVSIYQPLFPERKGGGGLKLDT